LPVINELVVVFFVQDPFEIYPATWISFCYFEVALPNGMNGLQNEAKIFCEPSKVFSWSILQLYKKVGLS
jgi:hypothetical protein